MTPPVTYGSIVPQADPLRESDPAPCRRSGGKLAESLRGMLYFDGWKLSQIASEWNLGQRAGAAAALGHSGGRRRRLQPADGSRRRRDARAVEETPRGTSRSADR